jgi:hypothetical protein
MDINDKERSGLYYLFDPNADPNEWEDPNVSEKIEGTDEFKNWHKLGTLGEIINLEEILNGKEAIGEEGTEGYQPAVDGLISQVAGLAAAVGDQTDTIAKLIQGSAEISVNENGSLGVKELNVNKLVQTIGDTLILSGGNAKNTAVTN